MRTNAKVKAEGRRLKADARDDRYEPVDKPGVSDEILVLSQQLTVGNWKGLLKTEN